MKEKEKDYTIIAYIFGYGLAILVAVLTSI